MKIDIQSKSFRIIILISLVIAFITGYLRGEERYFKIQAHSPKREISKMKYDELLKEKNKDLTTYFEYNYRDAIVVFIVLSLVMSLIITEKNFSSITISETGTLKNKDSSNSSMIEYFKRLKSSYKKISSFKKFLIFTCILLIVGGINYFPFSDYYYCTEKNRHGNCIDKIPLSTLIIVTYSIIWVIVAIIYALNIDKKKINA